MAADPDLLWQPRSPGAIRRELAETRLRLLRAHEATAAKLAALRAEFRVLQLALKQEAHRPPPDRSVSPAPLSARTATGSGSSACSAESTPEYPGPAGLPHPPTTATHPRS